MIRNTNPDIVLLMETDAWWDGQLAGLARAYPHIVSQPQDNTYGMHLFSTLALIDPQVRFLLDDDVPSITTGVQLRSHDVGNRHVGPLPLEVFSDQPTATAVGPLLAAEQASEVEQFWRERVLDRSAVRSARSAELLVGSVPSSCTKNTRARLRTCGFINA